MTARRAGAVAVGSVVATTLCVVLLAMWAASTGPGTVLRDDGEGPAVAELSPTEPVVTPSTGQGEVADDSPERGHGLSVVGRVLAFAFRAAVALGVGLLLLWLARSTLAWYRERRERRRLETAPGLDFDVVEPPDRVAREMRADAAEQRRATLEGSPRNAVVACWDRFETQGKAAGLERRSWETSSEYTVRVLGLVDADRGAVSRLGALYREARFSGHELTEADRDAAVAALDTIHRRLGSDSRGGHA